MTNRRDLGADMVVLECESRGIDIYRFNSEDYPVYIGVNADPLNPSSATLTTEDDDIGLGTAGIWIRRPQWPTVSPDLDDELDRELAAQESVAALGGVLRLLADRCVSPADSMQAARWKLPQLAVARHLGMRIPDTLVTSSPQLAAEFAGDGPTVIKAVAEARVVLGDRERVGLVSAAEAGIDWGLIRFAPVVLQRLVPKVADLRVTAVGRRLFAVEITTPAGGPVDFRGVDIDRCEYAVVSLDSRLQAACFGFLEHFGLRFGAFDFALDGQSEPWFLECNPAGQWGWLENLAGIPVTAALVDLLLEQRSA